MNVTIVSFFGHRALQNPIGIERALEAVVIDLLLNEAYVEFLVGRDGEFDLLAASVIRRCRREVRGDNSRLVWAMPYETAFFRNNEKELSEYYDEITVMGATKSGHYKAAHTARNRDMVQISDLVVCHVRETQGGAYRAMEYAKKLGKRCVNLLD